MKKIIYLFLVIYVTGCDTQSDNEKKLTVIEFKIQKDELIRTAKRVYDKGLTCGTGGDISVRTNTNNIFTIKATGVCFGDLDYSTLSVLNTDFELISGNPKPSSEAEIHATLYKNNPEISAIMHVHSPYATAWATSGKVVPAVTQQSVKILQNACIIPYFSVGSNELHDAIIQCYRNKHTRIVFMQNHGFFIIGESLNEIFYQAELVENTAKIAWISKTLGGSVAFDY